MASTSSYIPPLSPCATENTATSSPSSSEQDGNPASAGSLSSPAREFSVAPMDAAAVARIDESVATVASDCLGDLLPEHLGSMIMFAVQNLTKRGRFEDLASDLHMIMQKRFFNNEDITFKEGSTRKPGRVVSSSYDGDVALEPCNDARKVTQACADRFRYNVELTGKREHNCYRNDVTHKQLVRPKGAASAPVLHRFLKTVCSIGVPGDRYALKQPYLERIEHVVWNDFIAGPEPLCPHTPAMPKGPRRKAIEETKKEPKPSYRIDFGDLERSGPITLHPRSPSPPPPPKLKRKAPAISDLKSKILQQQEDFQALFEEAEILGIDIAEVRQTEKLISAKDLTDLKMKVKEEKAREKEERQRKAQEEKEKELIRFEDLSCQDLLPMPKFPALKLPAWMSPEEFGDYIELTQFFRSFENVLALNENCESDGNIDFAELVNAVRCNDPQDSSLADLLKILLTLRTELANVEDGDETSEDEESLSGEVRARAVLHCVVRKIHGKSVRHLPVDWMTVTEVVRLVFTTSGYLSIRRLPHHLKGNWSAQDDPGYQFCHERPELIAKLETCNLYDLSAEERCAILKALASQILYFTRIQEETCNRLGRNEQMEDSIRSRMEWDTEQENEANAIRLLRTMAGRSDASNRGDSDYTKQLKALLPPFMEDEDRDTEELRPFIIKVKFESFSLEEVDVIRRCQRSELEKDIRRVKTQMVITEARLGSDRVYRHYTIVDSLPALIVEVIDPTDLRAVCDEKSEIADPANLQPTAEQDVFLCSGDMETCTVHGKCRPEQPRWLYIESLEQFEEFHQSLHPKGLRESILLAELTEQKNDILRTFDGMEKAKKNGEWEKRLMTNETDPADSYNINWDDEIRAVLLDLEHKIDEGQMGSLQRSFGIDREQWRTDLKEKGDVTHLLNQNVTTRSEVLIDLEEVEGFCGVKKLSVALLLIVKTINMKFIEQPFLSPTKDEHGNLKPSSLFVRWQKALLNCQSISALSLFLSTIDDAIKWDRSRHRGQCSGCNEKAAPKDLIMCDECTECFHLECAELNLELGPIPYWKCAACQLEESKAVARAILEAEEETEKTETTITSSGRAVKKVRYAEAHEEEETVRRARKPSAGSKKKKKKSKKARKSGRAQKGKRSHREVEEDDDDDDDQELEESSLL